MHIVTSSDPQYLVGAMVLIASAHHHHADARFTLLGLNLSSGDEERVQALGRRLGCRIEVIQIGYDEVERGTTRASYISKATFMRLLIPKLVPDEDRVIYIDSDALVTGSLLPMWQSEMGDNILAGAPNGIGAGAELEMAARGITPETYFNAGVLVINLRLMEAEDVAERCFRFLEDPAVERYHSDQSALNEICRGRVLMLPPVFNVQPRKVELHGAGLKPGDRPVIVHYTGFDKPWFKKVFLGEAWRVHAPAHRRPVAAGRAGRRC